jgi:hypothetical protein
MFKNLSTSTKLFILCIAFVASVGLPVGELVMEKRIAIDFARKELVGSRYLATVREVCAAILSLRSRDEPREQLLRSGDALLKRLADAEAEAGALLHTSQLAQALAARFASFGPPRRRTARPIASSTPSTRCSSWPSASATIPI